MLNRVPLPPQLDRVIVVGGAAVAMVVGAIATLLLVLLAFDRLSAPEVVFWRTAALCVSGALGG